MFRLNNVKYHSLYLLSLILFLVSCSEKPISEDQALSFLKYYSGFQIVDEGKAVIQNDDGGYAILGTITTENWSKEICLILIDKFGNLTQPIQYYGNDNNDEGKAFLSANNGGYYIAGNTFDAQGLSSVMVIKTDAKGEIIWRKEYGEDDKDYQVNDMVLSNFNEELVLTGQTDKNSIKQLLVASFNRNTGDLIKIRSYGGTDYHIGYSIVNGENNRYYVVGSGKKLLADPTVFHMFVFGIPTQGNSTTDTKYETLNGAGEGMSINKIDNSNYIIASNDIISENVSEVVLMGMSTWDEDQGTNTDIKIKWRMNYKLEGKNLVTDSKILNNNIYTLFNSGSDQTENTVILRTNLSGAEPEYFEFGEEIGLLGNGLDFTNDQGLIITGKNNVSAANSTIYLLKLNSLLQLN